MSSEILGLYRQLVKTSAATYSELDDVIMT